MTEIQTLDEQIRTDLSKRYGEVIGGRNLRLVLGYASMAAFTQAVRNRKIDLTTFFISGRKGRFALTSEVASWIATLRSNEVVSPEFSAKHLRAKKKVISD